MTINPSQSPSGECLLPMFVLDGLRWADNLESLVNILNDDGSVGWRDVWGRPFTQQEVASAIEELEKQGLIERVEVRGYEALQHTAAGLNVWESWAPP